MTFTFYGGALDGTELDGTVEGLRREPTRGELWAFELPDDMAAELPDNSVFQPLYIYDCQGRFVSRDTRLGRSIAAQAAKP